jgi:hypothetical protein
MATDRAIDRAAIPDMGSLTVTGLASVLSLAQKTIGAISMISVWTL